LGARASSNIDLDKSNNNVNNLYLCDNKSVHANVHGSLEKAISPLIKAGMLVFNQNIKQYVAHDKLLELLEQLAEANQQPSLSSDTKEGSETRCESPCEIIIHPRARGTLEVA
jgi:hypothetical protein